VRRDEPYSVYPELEFDVPVGPGDHGVLGDSYARYAVRIREMVQSIRILRQCFRQMPDGPVIAKVPRKFRPPAGDALRPRRERARRHGLVRGERRHEYPYRCKDAHRARSRPWRSSTRSARAHARGSRDRDRSLDIVAAGSRPLERRTA
jgi:Ni,Fe-hydrogenase III large subunit